MTDTPFNDHRVERIEQLENEDVDPYPDVGDLDPSPISEFVAEYEDQDEIEGSDEWILAGRVTRSNEFGDFGFYDIDDRTGSVQVMCSVDDRSGFETDNYDQLDHVNSGDWLVFTGFAGRSDTGELTLHAEEFEIASPSLQDTADDDWNQLGEQKRITQRTAALRTDDELFDTVGSRFDIENSVRTFLRQGGYTEVQTPILHNVAGGAEATPFETHCNALDRDVYLRIAPELYLKRLITAGYDNVFEMSRCFRNEDIDTTHNPEFTMMELYERFSTYEDMMELTENLFAHVAESLTGSTEVEYDGNTVEFAPPWERVTFDSLIEEVFSQSVDQIEREQVVEFLVEDHEFEHHELEGSSFDDLLMEVFEEEIEPELDGPVFVQDYPASSTPLCRRDPDDDTRVQRFEAFVLGMEIANSYTELIDPREQRQRLIEQAGGEENINEEFVEALSHGMPPTAGLGIGIDRMAMLMTDSQSIKDVLAYPMTGSRV